MYSFLSFLIISYPVIDCYRRYSVRYDFSAAFSRGVEQRSIKPMYFECDAAHGDSTALDQCTVSCVII